MHRLIPWLLLAFCTPTLAIDSWKQWAGPEGDFHAPASRLSERWPDGSPRLLWERELGNGHAAIVVADGRLFTQHGDGKKSRIVAMDAATGRTLWEHAHAVNYAAHRVDWDGPHSTPLLAGGRLFAIAIDGQIHALDASTGKVLWRRDLVAELGVKLPQSGYAASPAEWEDLILLPGLGGAGPGAVALRQENGRTAWSRHSFRSSHASPVVIRLEGVTHAVFHGMNRMLGLDPRTGDRLWEARLRDGAADNVSFTPLWDSQRRLLVVSHAYDRAGARGLRLRSAESGWEVREVWTNRRLKVEHGNGVLLDGAVYASDGSDPAYLVGVDLDSGETRFKQRGVPKSTFLAADGKLFILDEEGTLHMGRPGEDGVEILASTPVLQHNAWTTPTLVGQRLYVRDRFHIKALVLP